MSKKKIAIAGRPGVGKTTLAKKLAEQMGLRLYHTDDLIGVVPFKDANDAMIKQLSDKESFIVEGVQVARMLRKGHRDQTFKPDKLIIVDSDQPVENRHKGLASLNHDPIEQWVLANPDVEIERITNKFE